MNSPVQVRHNLAILYRQRDHFQHCIAEHEAAEVRMQNAPFFRQVDLDQERQEKGVIQRQLAKVLERIRVLESKLPTASETASAEETAARLLTELDSAVARERDIWPRFAAAMEQAETVARELFAARRDGGIATTQVLELVRRYGLEKPLLATFAPENTVARHIALVLKDVAEGHEPDPTTELNLRAQRESLAS